MGCLGARGRVRFMCLLTESGFLGLACGVVADIVIVIVASIASAALMGKMGFAVMYYSPLLFIIITLLGIIAMQAGDLIPARSLIKENPTWVLRDR